jgi:hypothetical protein
VNHQKVLDNNRKRILTATEDKRAVDEPWDITTVRGPNKY